MSITDAFIPSDDLVAEGFGVSYTVEQPAVDWVAAVEDVVRRFLLLVSPFPQQSPGF